MSLQYQICSLIITALIWVIYATHKRLMLRSERVFYRALCFTLAMIIFDLTKVIMIQHPSLFPLCLTIGYSKLYECILVICSGITLVYLMADILKKEQYKELNKSLVWALLCESFLVLFHTTKINPIGFAYGPAVNVGVAIVAINFAITLVFLVKNINKVNSRRRFGIVLWMVIWITLALMQRAYPTVVLTGLAVSLGILILFALLEKPEAKLDKEYGCFNYFALINFLDEMLESKIPLSIISVSLKTSGSLTGDALYREASRALRILEKNKDVWVFRGISQDFICIAKSKEPIDKISADLEEASKQNPDTACYARIVRCYDSSSFQTSNEVLHFLSYAKDRDNDQARIFDADKELTQAYHSRKEVEIELRNALVENRVEAFFQPIYSVRQKRITSGEALARIRTRNGDIIMPSEFIHIAEENGSISELGYKIFEQTCDFLSKNPDLIDYMEINLSVVQCEDEALAQKLIEIMEQYKIPPQKINLEITETASITTKQKLLKNMERMLEYGVTFSLDDFGKGESNLMYMVDMPVSIVKLDYDMSKSYFQNDKAKYVVNAVEGMSHGLNMKLVAEGIETEEELKAMEKQRVDYIQGYYFSKPLPKDDFVNFVQAYNVDKDDSSGLEEEHIEKFRPA